VVEILMRDVVVKNSQQHNSPAQSTALYVATAIDEFSCPLIEVLA
jgi:hypothetical protein